MAGKPALSGTDPAKRDGRVQIAWEKSISDGVNMNPEGFRGYSKRGDEADFTLLHRDNESPTPTTARCSWPANPSCANTKPSASWPTTRSACSAMRSWRTARRDDSVFLG